MTGAVGLVLLAAARAANPAIAIEVEMGSGNAAVVNDMTASGGRAIEFVARPSPSDSAGARLPLQYSMTSLQGNLIFVSPNGSDSAAGTQNAPFATLSKAISSAQSGSTIVLRGGTYRQGGFVINKSLTVIAYPGETPSFVGADSANTGWTVSGNTAYRNYTSRPVTDGSGIKVTECQNLSSSCIGKFPDQVWSGDRMLRQVESVSAVTDDTFFVDRANNRVYVSKNTSSSGNVEISNRARFAIVNAPDVTLKGFRVIRYANGAAENGVILFDGRADRAVLDNMYVADSSFKAVAFAPNGSDKNEGSTVRQSTVTRSNWMGVTAFATDGFTMDKTVVSNLNPYNEFTTSPASGALKTSRTWNTKVTNSRIINNKSQGLWFDQSNYNVEVANNHIDNNSGSGLFFEISDRLFAVNNYVRATGGARAMKLAGGSSMYLVNNTVIGGADPIGVYVDARSIPGCSNPANGSSCGPYSSDLNTYFPYKETLTWQPSIDLFINNVVAYPTATGYCGTTTSLCITHKHTNATVDITTIIHKQNSRLGLPQTLFSGNAYANGSGNVIGSRQLGNFKTARDFAIAMSLAPVAINGFEPANLSGNMYVMSDGTPTDQLSSRNSDAAVVPNIPSVSKYIDTGTRHIGVTWK